VLSITSSIRRDFAKCLSLVFITCLTACSREEPEPDPRVLDQHLNYILAREEATYNEAVADARAREEIREREMTERINNYPTDAERRAMKNRGSPGDLDAGNNAVNAAEAPPS
jgi:hypothetical protein